MFREGKKLKGGRLERMIAAAMEVVYRDEKNHYPDAAREAASASAGPSRTWSEWKKAVREVSLPTRPHAQRDVQGRR